MHEKLVPSLDSEEHVDVCGLLELPVLLISLIADDEKLPIAPLCELSVASFVPVTPVWSCPKKIVPKSDSGRMPPLKVQHGASAIHSAEVRLAPDTVELLV